jgi:hypothetical protein
MTQKKSSEELLENISKKLDILIAMTAVQGKKTDDQISILKGMNYSWSEIGKFVGLAPDTVRMRYSRRKV